MSRYETLIKNIAFDLGFDAIGITRANYLKESEAHFLEWREKGYAADMSYLLKENPINAKPAMLLSEAKSIITLFVNYYTKPPDDPGPDYGRVASYAVGLDYHNVLKKKINLFQEKIKKETNILFLSRGFSDSVPLLEKSFAKKSGLGFSGKHTLIINKPFGSYFFICELISNLNLDPTSEASGTCGKCTRCLDICPTNALPEPYVLDSRNCISYLTIENKGLINNHLRKKIGEWVFGCDLCQEVCPYNKKIKETTWKEFKPESGIGHWIKLKDILNIKSDEDFKNKFSNTALTRPKRIGLIRNACIVAGNRKSEEAHSCLMWLKKNESNPIIQEHVLWALSCY